MLNGQDLKVNNFLFYFMFFLLVDIPLNKYLAFSRNFFITCTEGFYRTKFGETWAAIYAFLHGKDDNSKLLKCS